MNPPPRLYKFPMAGYEPSSSGVGFECSAKCATTAAQAVNHFIQILQRSAIEWGCCGGPYCPVDHFSIKLT